MKWLHIYSLFYKKTLILLLSVVKLLKTYLLEGGKVYKLLKQPLQCISGAGMGLKIL